MKYFTIFFRTILEISINTSHIFQMFNHHMWLATIILDSTGLDDLYTSLPKTS